MERKELIALGEKIDAMDLDHVFVLMPNGEIREPKGGKAYAPSVYDDEESGPPVIDDPEWSLITHGMSAQYGYSGPIMHRSEYIGWPMAEHMLYLCEDGPGVFAVVSVEELTHADDVTTEESVGWTIAQWQPKHVDFPHEDGRMVECSACEIHCVCADDDSATACVSHASDNPVIPGGIPTPFKRNSTRLTRQEAEGHKTRTGHDLTGYYAASGTPGVMRLVRTCCPE